MYNPHSAETKAVEDLLCSNVSKLQLYFDTYSVWRVQEYRVFLGHSVYMHIYRQRDRQADRQTGRQTGRQTDIFF